MIAAIRVRGTHDVPHKTQTTMHNLNLEKRNQCVIYEDEEAIKGMFNQAKDFITYGEISDETVEAIEESKEVQVEHGTVINLAPPSGGFRDTKRNVNQGGALGERENLDELLEKMI
ncbi:MAG: large subunit ribosomal protein L30 [Colwellia polaris]